MPDPVLLPTGLSVSVGDTRRALEAGSLTYQAVVAIEGFEYLITNGPTAAAVTAWAGTDWTQALGGLFVDLENETNWDPFNAFAGGGTCQISVAPDPLDILGKQIGRTRAGATTQLVTTVDAAETSELEVKSTSGFPSSGEVFIGTERIAYDSVTSTTFEDLTRGRYSPFLTHGGGGFGHQHRAGLVSALQTSLQPMVSQYRRSWRGAFIGVWIHRVVNGVLDTKAEAQCVFAGTVDDIYDAGETGHTVIVCKHIVDRIKDASLMRDTFKARIADGMRIDAGTTFEFEEGITGVAFHVADPLVCVSGTPANHKEFQAGHYSVTELCGVLNAWLAGEAVANGTESSYTLESPVHYNGKIRTVITWEQTSPMTWELTMPARIARFLGLDDNNNAPAGASFTWEGFSSLSDIVPIKRGSPFSPYRYLLTKGSSVKLTDVQGVFVDQYDLMPLYLTGLLPTKPPTDQGLEWGVFTLNGTPYLTGAIVESGGEYFLVDIRKFFAAPDEARLYVQYETESDPPNVELVQVFAIRDQFRNVIMRIFASTGAPGHNHAAYDDYPLALSLGIPWEMLGSAFEHGVVNFPEGDREMTLTVTEATSIEKLLNVDMILRGLHLVWKNQGLQFRRWQTPIASLAVAALTESNKAMPAGNLGTHRTKTRITGEWLTPIVSIVFARDWLTDQYTDGPLILEDRVSIDDMGGDAPTKKLEARNMTREDIEAIAPLFLELVQFFSRPAYFYERSMDQTLFEKITAGDVVTVTDSFARDPATGDRGMAVVPGLVVKASYSLGGTEPGDPTSEPTSQVGAVDVMAFPFERPAVYSPAAQVDHTALSGGFVAPSKTLFLVDHAYTPPGGPNDATFFNAGDKIEVTEIDPDDPTSPQTWSVEVASRSDIALVLTTGLTGFSSAKKYRVRSQPHGDAQASQLANAYEADEADGMIEDDSAPYTYGLPSMDMPEHTSESQPWPAELIPEMTYGDGAAHDAATDVQIVRMLNNLLEHKTALNAPTLHQGAALGHTVSSTRRILRIIPKCFGAMKPTPLRKRYVSVAPFFRSGDGTSCTITITLVGKYPKECSGFDNQSFDEPSSAASWTTSSTTWQTGTAADLDLSVLGEDGLGFLIIEGTAHLETFGLAKCHEGVLV